MNYVLSEADVALLREMAAWWRANGPPGRSSVGEAQETRGSDTLLIRTPVDGLPAMVEGVGTGTAPDILEGTECQVCYVDEDTGRLEPHPTYTETVWNTNLAAAPGNAVLVAHRERFGLLITGSLVSSLKKGVLSTSLAATGTAVMRVWTYNSATGLEVDTGEDITVRNWLLQGSQTAAAGSGIVAGFIDGQWYAIAKRC